MPIKFFFKCLTMVVIASFSCNYYFKSTHLKIKISGDIPNGYPRQQWCKDLSHIVTQNLSNPKAALETWLIQKNIQGSLSLDRTLVGHLTVRVMLSPFDLVINESICLKYNGTATTYPCFYNIEQVGFVTAPAYIEELMHVKKLYLKDLSILPNSYSININSFGYADLRAHNDTMCRLSLSKQLEPQLASCHQILATNSKIKFLDLTIPENILAFM